MTQTESIAHRKTATVRAGASKAIVVPVQASAWPFLAPGEELSIPVPLGKATTPSTMQAEFIVLRQTAIPRDGALKVICARARVVAKWFYPPSPDRSIGSRRSNQSPRLIAGTGLLGRYAAITKFLDYGFQLL